jgi:hypothetical protein
MGKRSIIKRSLSSHNIIEYHLQPLMALFSFFASHQLINRTIIVVSKLRKISAHWILSAPLPLRLEHCAFLVIRITLSLLSILSSLLLSPPLPLSLCRFFVHQTLALNEIKFLAKALVNGSHLFLSSDPFLSPAFVLSTFLRYVYVWFLSRFSSQLHFPRFLLDCFGGWSLFFFFSRSDLRGVDSNEAHRGRFFFWSFLAVFLSGFCRLISSIGENL